MTTVMELYPIIKQLWVVWLMLLFLGIAAWAFWPSRKAKFERYAQIPFNEDRDHGR